MSRRIDVRMDEELYLKLRECPGKVSYNVCEAVRQYVGDCTTKTAQCAYNVDLELVSALKGQITDLQRDKEFLKLQLVARQPLLQRIVMRLRGDVSK